MVMPISDMPPQYTAQHWLAVRDVIKQATDRAGFNLRMVSESDETTVIQSSIVKNLAEDEIVVCDVSGKNANVMLELGLRLCFDKPIVIIKDDETPHTFDAGPIKTIPYRYDLRFKETGEFVETLCAAILATRKKANDPKYSPFLKHFGNLKPKGLSVTEVSEAEYVKASIDKLSGEVRELATQVAQISAALAPPSGAVSEITEAVIRGGAINSGNFGIHRAAMPHGPYNRMSQTPKIPPRSELRPTKPATKEDESLPWNEGKDE